MFMRFYLICLTKTSLSDRIKTKKETFCAWQKKLWCALVREFLSIWGIILGPIFEGLPSVRQVGKNMALFVRYTTLRAFVLRCSFDYRLLLLSRLLFFDIKRRRVTFRSFIERRWFWQRHHNKKKNVCYGFCKPLSLSWPCNLGCRSSRTIF